MILNFNDYCLLESNSFIDLRENKNNFLYCAIHYKNNLILTDNYYDGINSKQWKDYFGFDHYNIDITYLIVDESIKLVFRHKYQADAGVKNGNRMISKNNINEIDPIKLKKLFNDLLSRNIITSKFKFEIKDESLKISKEKIESINFNESDFFYHGTTSTKLDSILKLGLRPQDTDHAKSLFRNNSSTIIGYTDKNVYLTKSIDIAKTYALRQTRKTEDEPIVLKIQIPDESKLLVDDDYILREIRLKINIELNKISKKINIDSNEAKDLLKYLDTLKNSDDYLWKIISSSLDIYTLLPKNFTKNNIAIYSIREHIENIIRNNLFSIVTDNKIIDFNPKYVSYNSDYSLTMNKYYQDQLSSSFYQWIIKIVKSNYSNIINTNYKKSLYSGDQAVAYHGVIMPKFIEVLNLEFKTFKY